MNQESAKRAITDFLNDCQSLNPEESATFVFRVLLKKNLTNSLPKIVRARSAHIAKQIAGNIDVDLSALGTAEDHMEWLVDTAKGLSDFLLKTIPINIREFGEVTAIEQACKVNLYLQ